MVFIFLAMVSTIGCGPSRTGPLLDRNLIPLRADNIFFFDSTPERVWCVLDQTVRSEKDNLIQATDPPARIITWSREIKGYDCLEGLSKDWQAYGFPPLPALVVFAARVSPRGEGSMLYVRCTFYTSLDHGGVDVGRSRGEMEKKLQEKIRAKLKEIHVH